MKKVPIVLIRGLLREERHWGSFPTRLQACMEDRDVITLTLAGVGKRNYKESPTSISAMVDDLRTELSRHHPQAKKVILVGLSMGGMITIDWCQRFPDQVEKALLINTSARPFSRIWERLRLQAYGSMLKTLFADAKVQEAETLAMTSNMPIPQSLADDWGRWRQECPISGKTVFNQLWACARFRAEKKPEVPMLVLASPQDKMVSPSCSYKLAESWELPVEKHPTAGHDIPIDDPEWVCEKVKSFIDKC